MNTAANERRETLLVIDNDDVFAEVLATALGKRGFRALTAPNMDETLRLLRNEAPSKAVIDLRLGTTSGLQFLPILKASNPAIQIVVLSSFSTFEMAATALRLGACHYLAKPVDADEIVAAFSQI